MSATICRCTFQIRYRSGNTVSIPSGPGGSASEPDSDRRLLRGFARAPFGRRAASDNAWVCGGGTSAITRSIIPATVALGRRGRRERGVRRGYPSVPAAVNVEPSLAARVGAVDRRRQGAGRGR